MASSKIFTSITIVAIFVPSILATEFVVGDKTGWTTNFDYQTWAEGKEFHVGDTLVFNYPLGIHNVLRVNGTEFAQCMALSSTEALTSGNDVITLASPGRKWYICGVGKHCEVGNQKLAITVLLQLGSPAASPSPSANPTSSATGSIVSTYHAWLVALVGIVGIVIT